MSHCCVTLVGCHRGSDCVPVVAAGTRIAEALRGSPAPHCGLRDAVTAADACPGPTIGPKASNVLFFSERQAPQDHQRDGDQCKRRRHQASDGGHGVSCEWLCPRSGVRLTPS